MVKDIDILVIGSLNMDLIIESERNPKPGETIRGTNFYIMPGGKGNNQGVAIGRLGGKITFAGCLGEDEYGRLLAENLKNNNVDISGVIRTNTPTGTALINVFNGQNTIILYSGANSKCSHENLLGLEELIKRSKILLMQLEIPMETVEWAIDKAKEMDTKVILNPAPASVLKDELYKKIDILIPNEIEARDLLSLDDKTSYEELLNIFINKGVNKVIITLGSEGVIYSEGENVYNKPAYKVKAIDSTGAGDAFIGGLCTSISKGKSFEEAIDYASRVAAIKVTRFGAQEALPREEEVEAFEF
ncbi:MAG TPA: ribokinase [Clostridiaceae bacterium]